MTTSLTIPLYTAKLGGQPVRYMDNDEKSGFSVVTRVTSSTKGAADLFGMGNRISRFAAELIPHSELNRHAGVMLAQARTALSIPHLLFVTHQTVESFKNRKYYAGTRNGLEMGSAASFATSLFVPKAISSVAGGVGATFKTAVDVMDLGTNVDKMFHFNSLRSKANKAGAASEQVKSGIKAELRTAILKVIRFALAVFSGVLTVMAFAFKVAISKELLLAGLITSTVSLIFSFIAEINIKGSSKIPVSKELWKLHEKQQLHLAAAGT